MNDDEPILIEIRKISAWAELQRNISKWSLIFLAVFVPGLIIFALLMTFLVEQRAKRNLESLASENIPSWYDVHQNVRRGDFDKAIQIGEELVLKTPLYSEAHRNLGEAYLAAGNIEKARQHYAEAFRLFPSDENEKLLAAIDRRREAENPQLDGAVTGDTSILPETNPTPSPAGSRR